MNDSEWVVLLPLVGAVVGGIVGAWANSLYRDREAKKARDEEREGLLILLGDEVAINNMVFDTFLKESAAQPDIDNRASVAAALHSAVWDESKARLTQLQVPRTYLATVAAYYRRLDWLRQNWAMPGPEMSEDDTERVREIRGNGVSVIRATHGHISDPRFFAHLLDEDASGRSDNSKEANPT